jgi:hypothetical protein
MCTQIHCSTLNIDGSIYITLSTICCKMTESSAKDPERCKCKKINGDNACPPTTTPGIVASSVHETTVSAMDKKGEHKHLH